MPRSEPKHDWTLNDLIDWAIQVQGDLEGIVSTSQQAAQARAKLHELMNTLKGMLAKGETSHEHISGVLEGIKTQLLVLLDIQVRLKVVENEIVDLQQKQRNKRIKDEAINWTPVVAAIAAAIAAAASYFFPGALQ